MFEAINNSKFPGIEYTAHLPTKIPHEHEDDTFQQKLSMKIQADDFYQANIKINKDKTVLLTNNKTFAASTQHTFNFGENTINVEVLPLGKGTRILGVYLSANNSNNTTLSKIHNMVNYFSYLIRIKKLTHDHIKAQASLFIAQTKPNEQQGRIPRWYTFLKDKITRQSNTGRLNIDLGTNLIQNPKVQRLRPPPVTNEPISYKGRFTVWRSTIIINALINEQVIRNQLWFAARHLNNFAHLEYFTDGSFNAEPSSPEFQMDYGWTTSNLQEFNWTHKGAVEYMPSSTKGHFDCFNRVSL
ncbi:unnamed protein product [Rhizophagus irregularis]|nr:unnamed protein product [Rhizophagus irregularis]